jgi:hypothetical protein
LRRHKVVVLRAGLYGNRDDGGREKSTKSPWWEAKKTCALISIYLGSDHHANIIEKFFVE